MPSLAIKCRYRDTESIQCPDILQLILLQSHLCNKKSELMYLNCLFQAHSVDKTFHCTQCDKTFKELRTLRLHLKIHNADYPEHCEVCKKGFRTKWQVGGSKDRVQGGISRPLNVSVKAALNGSWRQAALPVPGVQFHLQDKTTAQRAQEKTLGEF